MSEKSVFVPTSAEYELATKGMRVDLTVSDANRPDSALLVESSGVPLMWAMEMITAGLAPIVAVVPNPDRDRNVLIDWKVTYGDGTVVFVRIEKSV